MHWIRRHPTGRPPHPDVLTPAEWRVLDHVRDGRSNPEIADALGVSVNTVRTHVSSMLAKLEVSDRAALAAWRGEPAEASRAALGRFHLAGPLGLLTHRWAGRVALAAGGVAVAAVFLVALDATTSPGGGVPAADEMPVATTSVSPEPTSEPTSDPTTEGTAEAPAAPMLMPFAGVTTDLAPVLPVDNPVPVPEVPSPFEPIEWDDPDLHLYDVEAVREWNLGSASGVGFNPDISHYAWFLGARSSSNASRALYAMDLQSGTQIEVGVAHVGQPIFWLDNEHLFFNDVELAAGVSVNVMTGQRIVQPGPTAAPPQDEHAGSRGLTDELILREMSQPSENLWRRRWRLEYRDDSRSPVLFDAHWASLGPDNALVFAVTAAPEPSKTPGEPRRLEDLTTPGNVYLANPFTMTAEYIATVNTDYWNWPLDVSEDRIAWTQNYCSPEPRTQIFDRETGEVVTLDTGDWLQFIPDGDIAFGSFGAKRILDVERLEYRAVLPLVVADVGWSSDYRYAVRGLQGGHGGYCP